MGKKKTEPTRTSILPILKSRGAKGKGKAKPAMRAEETNEAIATTSEATRMDQPDTEPTSVEIAVSAAAPHDASVASPPSERPAEPTIAATDAPPADVTPVADPTPKPKKAKNATPKKTSCLDAAAKVLAESGEPMTTQAMIDAMARQKLWSSPNGQTPAATLYSAILREINTKGDAARFVKTERGKFAAKA